MPMYEFTCRKCSHQFEELTTLAEVEAGELVCPGCGSKQIERGFSTFATSSADGGAPPGGGGCSHGFS